MIVDHHTSVTATLSAPSVRSVPGYFKGAYHCSPGQRAIGPRYQLGLAGNSSATTGLIELITLICLSVGGIGGWQAAALMSESCSCWLELSMACVGRKQPTSQHAQGLLGTLTAPFD